MANNAVTNFHANSRLHFIGSWRARYDVFLDAKLAQGLEAYQAVAANSA